MLTRRSILKRVAGAVVAGFTGLVAKMNEAKGEIRDVRLFPEAISPYKVRDFYTDAMRGARAEATGMTATEADILRPFDDMWQKVEFDSPSGDEMVSFDGGRSYRRAKEIAPEEWERAMRRPVNGYVFPEH